MSRLTQWVITGDSQATGIGKRRGVKALLIYFIWKEQKTLKVLDLNLYFPILEACLEASKAGFPCSTVPSGPRNQSSLRGWVEGLVTSSPGLPPRPEDSLWKMPQRCSFTRSWEGNANRAPGCGAISPGAVVPKPASSMRTQVGFDSTGSQVLSQRFYQWPGVD